MTIFETAKTNIPFTSVLNTLGIHVEKGYYLCQFHDDRKPSAKIYTRSNDSTCFVCNKQIDSINLYSQRFNLKPLAAARKLLSDFSISHDDSYVYKKPIKTAEQKEDAIVFDICTKIDSLTRAATEQKCFDDVMYAMNLLNRSELTNCAKEVLLNHIKGGV